MTRILILYGTTDGHTAKVARFLADELRPKGVIVDVFQAGKADPDPRDYDGVLVAASVHIGGYQKAVVRWVRARVEALRGRPTAFLSVCLGVLQKDLKVQRELDAITKRFKSQTGWLPPEVKVVAGALRYTRYGWLTRMVMRRIAKKAGGSTDASRDHEYTDWADLRAFAGSFFSRCVAAPTAAEACGAACSCSFQEVVG